MMVNCAEFHHKNVGICSLQDSLVHVYHPRVSRYKIQIGIIKSFGMELLDHLVSTVILCES